MKLKLDLLAQQDKIRVKSGAPGTLLWDPVRRQWVHSTPEELVRQLLILHLSEVGGFRLTHMQVERVIKVNGMTRRFDLLLNDADLQPFLLVECKSPTTQVDQNVFEQIAHYNSALQVPYLLVTNGTSHFCCAIDHQEKQFSFLDQIPRPTDSIQPAEST